MKAGPKGSVNAEPLDLSGWPKGRAKRRERFISEYLVTPKGVGAREPFKLRPFQRDIVKGAFAPGVRTALVSLPRGNGKSALAAALAPLPLEATMLARLVCPGAARLVCPGADGTREACGNEPPFSAAYVSHTAVPALTMQRTLPDIVRNAVWSSADAKGARESVSTNAVNAAGDDLVITDAP